MPASRPAASKIMPIQISPNGRYFLDKRKKPLFFLGDTLWLLFRAHTPAEVKAILRDRKAKGFNAILIMLIGFEETPMPNLNGDLPFMDNDPSRPNERYFAHVDTVMRIAAELDLILICGVYHKTHGKLYTPKKAKASARWIAHRYKNVPQIIWSMYPEAKNSCIPIARALAEGLHKAMAGRIRITVHPDPSPQSSNFLHHEKWLAFNMLQTWCDFELVHPMTAADYALNPVKPAVMAEGGYEGTTFKEILITPADMRRQAYWTYLAGGHHVYGHHEIHRFPADWKKWIAAPGAAHVGMFKKIISALPHWWDVVPDQSIIMKGIRDERELNAAARSGAGDWALVYLSTPCAPLIRMDRIKTSERILATWIDSITGKKTRIGKFQYADVKEFPTPAGWEDALLLLEAS